MDQRLVEVVAGLEDLQFVETQRLELALPELIAQGPKSLDDWTSPGLPRRARLLLFGVIACALNCPYSRAEICRLLESTDLTREEVEQIFANLTSPRLDPLEVKLMGLARETVRYRPEKIQKLMREVAGNLSRAQLLEVVGVCALGNALSRLSFLLP